MSSSRLDAFQGATKRVVARRNMQQSLATVLGEAYATARISPRGYLERLLQNNTTHFDEQELRRLLAAYLRVTSDRLSFAQFAPVVKVRGAMSCDGSTGLVAAAVARRGCTWCNFLQSTTPRLAALLTDTPRRCWCLRRSCAPLRLSWAGPTHCC